MSRPDETSIDKCSTCGGFTLISTSVQGVSLPEGTFCKNCLSELVRLGLKHKTGQTVKWYYSIPFVILELLLFGPFALPVLWKSDKFSSLAKVILTSIVAISTVLGIVYTMDLIRKASASFQATMNNLLGQ